MVLHARAYAVLGLTLSVAISFPAVAQKNSGPLLPVVAPRPRAAAPAPLPLPRRTTEPSTQQPGSNPQAAQLAERLPLDPQTRGLRDRMPPDPGAIQRRLGLRPASGPVTDLRGHTPTSREIANALAPR